MNGKTYIYVDGKEYPYVFRAGKDGVHLDASTPKGNRKVDISYEEMYSKIGIKPMGVISPSDWVAVEIATVACAYEDTFADWEVFISVCNTVYKRVTEEEAAAIYKAGYREFLCMFPDEEYPIERYTRPQEYVGKNKVFWKEIVTWRTNDNWKIDYIEINRFVT